MTALISRASQFCIVLASAFHSLVACCWPKPGPFVGQHMVADENYNCRCATLRSALMADKYCTRRMYRRSGR
jgi:hypothetical protein